jgi:hypothetical protein
MIHFDRRDVIGLYALLVAAVLSAGQGLAKAAQPANPTRFTADVAERFRRAAPKLSVRITAPLRLEVSGGASGAHDVILERIYAACTIDPDNCGSLVDDYVGKVSAYDLAPTPPLDRGTLRIIVRKSDYVDQMRKVGAAGGGPVATPIAGDFWMVLASDQPTTIRVVSVHDLAALGLDAKAALALAKANMADDMQSQIKAARKGKRRGIKVMAGSPYESSLFAFPELWAPSKPGASFLVAMPASDVLVYCGDASPDAVGEVAATAREVMAHDDRPLSDAVFQWTPEGWKPLSPPH